MRILIVTPAPPRSRKGNAITASRWSRILRQLGHRVAVRQQFDGESCDLLLALHARRSAASIRAYRDVRPTAPLILALTGTDLYRDIRRDAAAQRSLQLSDRLVLLQPHGLGELPPNLHVKARVILQSVAPPRSHPEPLRRVYEVAVVGHLRPVKDPFRAARAARRLPTHSAIRIVHLGAALTPGMQRAAEQEMRINPRYRWLGERSRGETLRRVARSRLLALTSRMEGGANVISEAIVVGVPVISSRISGSLGLLGEDYPGYFEVGDTRGLADLLWRVESDPDLYRSLRETCLGLQPLFEPQREREAWSRLLAEFG